MIGAAAVFSWASAELREGHSHDLVVFTVSGEILEGAHACGELVRRRWWLFNWLACIIAALGNEVNTGLHIGVNEGGDSFE